MDISVVRDYTYIFTKVIDEFNTKAVFVSDKNEKRFVAKREQLIDDGYEILCDSMTSLEHAYAYALEYEVFPEYCTHCGTYTELSLYRGEKYDNDYNKFIVFTGYLCDGCGTDDDWNLVVNLAGDYKPKLM